MEYPKLFLTDVKSYNEGNQCLGGHWVDMSEFATVEDFNHYCEKHFEKLGVKDPEILFTHSVNFPKSWYSDLSPNIDKIIWLANNHDMLSIFNMKDEGIALYMWNEFCAENGYDDELFEFNDEFFNIFFPNKPMEAAKATQFGNLNWSDKYIYFDGNGNLQSTNNPFDIIDIDALLNWKFENQ